MIGYSKKTQEHNTLGLRGTENKTFQKSLTFVMLFHIIFMQCKNMLVTTSAFMLQYNSLLNSIAAILIALLYGYLVINCRILQRIPKSTYLVIFFIYLFWVISILFDPKLFIEESFPYSYVRLTALQFIVYSLPLFITASTLTDADLLLYGFYKLLPVTFFVATVSFLFFIIDAPKGNVTYSQAYGYQVLLCSMFLMFRYRDTNKKKYLMMFAATVVYILIAGSRGPIVCIAVLLLYASIKQKKTIGNIFLDMFLLLVMLLGIVLYKEIAIWVNNTAYSVFGVRSRTVAMVLADNVNSTDTRQWYIQTLLNKLNEFPFFLTGLGAFGGNKTVGQAHSFYVDIFANLGFVVGSLFLIFILLQIFTLIAREKESSRSIIILIFSIMLFPIGFFGEQLWESWQLWIILGLLMKRRFKFRIH